MDNRPAILEDSADAEPPHRIVIANEQQTLAINEPLLEAAVRSVLVDSPFESADISVAVVDDPTIHELNRRYLQHDYPTDVLSFSLEDDGRHLVGELVASADAAAANAAEYGWSAADELLLYLVHGTLHLVGYEDATAGEAAEMRRAETAHLAKLGISIPTAAAATPEEDSP